MRISRSVLLVFGLGLLAASGAEASSNGINGFSGDPGTGGLTCNECHSGGTPPAVTLSGPTTVSPGSINTYTLTMTGGQSTAGGLDVSVSSGTLSVNLGDGGTQLLNGEITHTGPRQQSGFPPRIIWSFDWQAPGAPGSSTVYAAGNSVNLGQGSNGDRATTTTLQVTVAGAAGTPGETSEPGTLQPLRVTGYNSLTGEITISYEGSCESDQHNIYYGPLSGVSTWNWTDQVCDIGTTGTASFTPVGNTIFFVVVGNKSGAEGSYGRDSDGTERAPTLMNVCGENQDLSSTCTP